MNADWRWRTVARPAFYVRWMPLHPHNMPNLVRVGQRALPFGARGLPDDGWMEAGCHDRTVSLRRSAVVSPVMDPGRTRAALRSAYAPVPAEGIGQGISRAQSARHHSAAA